MKSKKKKAKDRLWKLVSEYSRRKFADSEGMVKCVTCTTVKHWKELHAGHWIPQAQGDAIRFELNGINPQCYRCNINLGGNGPEYYIFMLEHYGQDEMDRLRKRQHEIVRYTEADYLEMIEDMKLKLQRFNQ